MSGGRRLEDQALATLRGQLVEIISGAIFVFVGLAACAIAAIRRSGVRLFLWLGIWSAMYGTGLLTRAPAVVAALPRWLQMSLPYANAANTYLVVVVAFFAFLELTVGRLSCSRWDTSVCKSCLPASVVCSKRPDCGVLSADDRGGR